MFEPRQLPQFGTARAGASAAVLAPAQADPASGRLAALAGLAGNLFDHLNSSNWAPDLAEEIGSARWFRGLGTLVGLVLAGIALGPDFQAVAAPPAMPLDANAREEFRSQMI